MSTYMISYENYKKNKMFNYVALRVSSGEIGFATKETAFTDKKWLVKKNLKKTYYVFILRSIFIKAKILFKKTFTKK